MVHIVKLVFAFGFILMSYIIVAAGTSSQASVALRSEPNDASNAAAQAQANFIKAGRAPDPSQPSSWDKVTLPTETDSGSLAQKNYINDSSPIINNKNIRSSVSTVNTSTPTSTTNSNSGASTSSSSSSGAGTDTSSGRGLNYGY